MTIKLKMVSGGKKYGVEKDKYDQLENFILYAHDNMTSPCMFHLLSHIDDIEAFKVTKRTLLKEFQRELKRQFKSSSQNCPKVLIAYSIELKYTTLKEVNGEEDAYAYNRENFLTPTGNTPFLHIHFHVIADCNKTDPRLFKKYAIAALNNLKGLRAGRYFKSNQGELYKKVKESPDDCFSRILYIGKIEQKSPDIPFRKTFGMSSLPTLYVKEL